MSYNEADKTHHGIDSREKAKEPRMYETRDEFCPLGSFEKYLSKLNPNCDRLLQRPKRSFRDPESKIWFENAPLGINKINSFMAKLSEAANLSQRYTNHCIRAFVSTHLKSKGFSNEAIMSVTGHRNVQSLTSYIKSDDDERQEVSNALAYKSRSSSEAQSSHGSLEAVAIPEGNSSDKVSSSENSIQVVSSNSTSLSSMNMSGREYNIFSGSVQAGTINVNFYNSK